MPAGGTPGWPHGSMSIDAPRPGVYVGSADGACGEMQYVFGAPVPPGTDCSGGVPPSCSPYSAVAYATHAASSCYGATGPAIGSWRIEPTAATPTVGPGAGDSYLVHGSLTANLVGGASGERSSVSA